MVRLRLVISKKAEKPWRARLTAGPPRLCVWIERGLRDVRSCVCKHFFLTLLILLLFLELLVNGL